MTALTRVTFGENPVKSSSINQIIDAWNGNTAGVNQGNSPLALTGINDPINYAMAVRNADTAGKGLIIYAPDGVTPLLRVDKTNGVYASPDGVAAAAPILTTTGTQTLTNKTLTSPVLNGAVSGSAGFGAWTTFTPTLAQSNAPSLSTAVGRYTQIGKLVVGMIYMVASSGGTAANAIVVGGLPVGISNNGAAFAFGNFVRTGTLNHNLVGLWASANSLSFTAGAASTGSFGVNPAVTIANGDQMSITFIYEAP